MHPSRSYAFPKKRVPAKKIKPAPRGTGSIGLPTLYRSTVIVTFAEWLSEPEVPISSIVVVPLGARLLALNVIVTVALPFAGGVTGLAVAVPDTPLGNSLTLSSTGELNPPVLVMVRVSDALPPSMIVTEEGDTAMVKFFVPEEAFTVSAIVAL